MLVFSSARWVSTRRLQIPSPGPVTTSKVCRTCSNPASVQQLTSPLSFIGVYKRGVSLGFIIGWGNLNGIVSSNIYRDKDKPRYYPGHGVVLGYLVLFLFGGSVVQYLLLRRENGKRRRGERDQWVEGLDHSQIELLGDKRPDFMYTL